MKLSNIIKIAAVAALVVLATGCQTKKQKEAAERARLEAEAAAKAAAEAAALAARVFVLTEDVTAVSCGTPIAEENIAYSVEDFAAKFNANIKANAYGATTLVFPVAGIKFGVERCDFTPEQRALIQEFVNSYLKTDKTAKVLVEAYCADTADKEYDKEIAIERGIRVEALLKKYGVDRHNIEVVSYCPCKTNKALKDYSTKADKRRVNISIK